MKKVCILAVCFALSSSFISNSHAELVQLDDQSMANSNGKNGILIDNDMSLNRVRSSSGELTNAISCQLASTDCEFAYRFAGDDNWLVIYDLSGGIHVKNLKIGATTVDGETNSTPAIEIGDTSGDNGTETSVTFNHFGADSWAFTSASNGVEGFRTAVPTGAAGSLDEGKPNGLWDLRIDGTLTMTGGLKLFNCEGIAGC